MCACFTVFLANNNNNKTVFRTQGLPPVRAPYSFIISGLEEATLKLSCIPFNVKHLCYILSNVNNLTQYIHTVDAFIRIEAR